MKSTHINETINASLPLVWKSYTTDKDIIHWNFSSPEGHCPQFHNDFLVGGNFDFLMAAKNGSFSFHFSGRCLQIDQLSYIHYKLDDGREVKISFIEKNQKTHINIDFELKAINPEEMQVTEWQAILSNFKVYVESQL